MCLMIQRQGLLHQFHLSPTLPEDLLDPAMLQAFLVQPALQDDPLKEIHRKILVQRPIFRVDSLDRMLPRPQGHHQRWAQEQVEYPVLLRFPVHLPTFPLIRLPFL